jgi:hypothetical protein
MSDRNSRPTNKIPSEELAALVIDALLDADIVRKEDVAKAIKIAAKEIEVRKALGDY